MKNKVNKIFIKISILIFWLLIWEIFARKINLSFVLPTVSETFYALYLLVQDRNFLLTVITSLMRITEGFILGSIIAIALGILSAKVSFFKHLFSPINTVLKSSPVAVIIIMLWVLIGGKNVPVAVSLIMVAPIIWQNIIDGYDAIDPQLDEVCLIYNFNFSKRFRILVLPNLLKYLLPGLISASGLAWKAGVAAEIICMTKNSIGAQIYNAKYLLDGPVMFAWTIVILILSYLIEQLIKLLIGGISKKCHLS